MCGYPNKEVYEMDNAAEWFDNIVHEIRDGNIGEPVRHVEFEPLPPVEVPTETPVEAPAQEPVPV